MRAARSPSCGRCHPACDRVGRNHHPILPTTEAQPMIRSLLAQAVSFFRARPAAAPKKARPVQLEALEDRQMLAADPTFFDANNTAWYAYYDQSSSQFSQVFAQRKGDSIPVDLEITEAAGQARIGSVWV